MRTLWRNEGWAQQLPYIIAHVGFGMMLLMILVILLGDAFPMEDLWPLALFLVVIGLLCAESEICRRKILRGVSIDEEGILTFTTDTTTFRCHRDTMVAFNIEQMSLCYFGFWVVIKYKDQERLHKKRFSLSSELFTFGLPQEFSALEKALQQYIPKKVRNSS